MGGQHKDEQRQRGEKTKDTSVKKTGEMETSAAAVQTPIEAPIQVAAVNPDWYEGLRERMSMFREYQNRFAFPKEIIPEIFDLQKLEDMTAAAHMKFFEFSTLEEVVVRYHNQMMSDVAHDDKKEEGEEFFSVCASCSGTCKRLFGELIDALENRKKEIRNNPGLAKKNRILARFRALKDTSPLLMLIRNVKVFEEGRELPQNLSLKDNIKAKVAGMVDTKLGKGTMESLASVASFTRDVKQTKDTADGVKSFVTAVESGTGGGEETSALTGIFGMVKSTASLIVEVVSYLKDYDKMSPDNRDEKIAQMVTDGLKVAADAGGKIAELIGQFPIVGGIIGLIKNSINFFIKGFQFYKSQKRINQLRENKKTLKVKMLKRKERYQNDPQMEKLKLYSYVSQNREGKAYVNGKTKNSREQRGVTGSGSAARNAMKDHAAGGIPYYKAKAEEALEQYDEMKEAVNKNKNVKRAAVLDIVTEGIEVVGNIASFFPGVGSIVQAGTKAASATVSTSHKFGSWMVSTWKDKTGNKRSTENKKKFRSKYAAHIYDNMAEVSLYVDADGQRNLEHADEGVVKGVERSYDYAERMLEGMAANMPELIRAKNKAELMEKMSRAFSREG